jgi:lactate dehydrogenase-like 2-hydroxyacid dehydrogenase
LRPRVVVTHRLPPSVEHRLAEAFDARLNASDRPLGTTGLIEAMRESDGLLCTVTDAITAEVLRASERRVRIVANFGAGTDRIDLAAARAERIVVTNTPGVLTDDTADLTLLLMLAVARRAGEGERELRAGRWGGWRPTHHLGTSLRHKTLGIIGFGRIGRQVARRAHAAFDMRVLYATRTPLAPGVAPFADAAESVDELLPRCDVVSLHVPATVDTRHIIDARRLSLMRRDAFLINTARGDLVDESALADVLRSGSIAGAGLDVFEREPEVTEALVTMDNVVLLPHIGSATHETRIAMGERALANLDAFFSGSPPPDRVA